QIKSESFRAVENQFVTVKICLRKFCLDFVEFMGFALKNPIRGVAPEPHELFEKSSTKTFSCHSYTLR
ncbi:MAG: hypothetical protein IJU14_05445, partial [Clostridia bacterium]|nr:hypothetical protein [Clostridia bacterium]